MIKIIIDTGVSTVKIRASDLAPGDVVQARGEDGELRTYLRIYGALVNLENPQETWDVDVTKYYYGPTLHNVTYCDAEIRLFRRGGDLQIEPLR